MNEFYFTAREQSARFLAAGESGIWRWLDYYHYYYHHHDHDFVYNYNYNYNHYNHYNYIDDNHNYDNNGGASRSWAVSFDRCMFRKQGIGGRIRGASD